MNQIGPFKALGPDGFGAYFCQNFWGIVGDDIVKAAVNFLEGGEMEEVVNFTHITLILKIQDPVTVHDFRPINLCNVMYKITAKILVTRMKLVRGKVIARKKSAFLPRRLISDNIIWLLKLCIP